MTTNTDRWLEAGRREPAAVTSRYTLGLDLGQKRDHTAIAVVQRRELVFSDRDPVTWQPRTKTEYRLPYVKRLPLGLPYPEVVTSVEKRLARLARNGEECTLVVDATGVGAPVVDLFRRCNAARRLLPVTITTGARETQTPDGWNVPKRDLVTGLQLMYDQKELQMAADMPDITALFQELAAMRVRISASGNESFAAWREGAHDDLVLAVALAVWGARRTPKSPWGKVRLI